MTRKTLEVIGILAIAENLFAIGFVCGGSAIIRIQNPKHSEPRASRERYFNYKTAKWDYGDYGRGEKER